jgi:ferric-dicitrate binding protein FerR (iron transport regulator)
MAPQRQREKLVQFRVSDPEHAEISEKADRVGMAVGSYARRTLLDDAPARAVRRPPIDRASVSQVLASLGPLATDIRDLAKAPTLSQTELDRLDTALAFLSDMRDLLMRSIGRNP